MGARWLLDTPGLCKRPVMQMLKATNTNTCKHAMERVALRRGLISARTGEERLLLLLLLLGKYGYANWGISTPFGVRTDCWGSI